MEVIQMAKDIIKDSVTASKGHHTFTFHVWETGKTTVASDGSSGSIEVGYKLSMYGGAWDFNWNSKKV
jgi:hypothetical protein